MLQVDVTSLIVSGAFQCAAIENDRRAFRDSNPSVIACPISNLDCAAVVDGQGKVYIEPDSFECIDVDSAAVVDGQLGALQWGVLVCCIHVDGCAGANVQVKWVDDPRGYIDGDVLQCKGAACDGSPAAGYINFKLAACTSLDGQGEVGPRLERDPLLDGACEGFAFGDGEGMVGAYGYLYLFRQGDALLHADGGSGCTFQCVFQGGGIGNAYLCRWTSFILCPCPYGR